MAGSVNKVILMGNLGRDPEVRHFENGGAVANFPIATTESYYDREKGERVNLPTDWHNISVRRPGLVKVVESYLKKGRPVFVEGKLRTRTYEKEGTTHYVTEVVVDELVLIGGNRDQEQMPGAATPGADQAKPAEPTTPLPKSDDQDDDLPF